MTIRKQDETDKIGEEKPSFWSKTDVEALIRVQKVKEITCFEDLLGDFWPEEESTEEFLATLREWRREGS